MMKKMTEYKKLNYLEWKTGLLLPVQDISECKLYVSYARMFIKFVLKELADGEGTIASGLVDYSKY